MKQFSMIVVAVFLGSWYLLQWLPAGSAHDILLHENFDTPTPTPFGRTVLKHSYTALATAVGTADSAAVKVRYLGGERGSERVVMNSAFSPQQAASLTFNVQFCPGFDFARGGKLHGLGSARPVSGGNAVTEDRWSARLMWRRGGGLMTYIYHQDMKGKYGDTRVAPDFNFKAGHYYSLKMTVQLNTKPTLADGYIEVKVDDEKVIYHDKLRFRSTESADGLIQTLMFNTFYGGSSPDWAPRNIDGSFKTDCAYFDDFKVVTEAVTAGALK